MRGSVVLLLLPSQAAGDSESGVDLRVHRAETESEDRQVYSDLQQQCCLETGKAGDLSWLRVRLFVPRNSRDYRLKSLSERGSKGNCLSAASSRRSSEESSTESSTEFSGSRGSSCGSAGKIIAACINFVS